MTRMTQQTDRFENRENDFYPAPKRELTEESQWPSFFFFNQPLESSAHFQKKKHLKSQKDKKKNFGGLVFFPPRPSTTSFLMTLMKLLFN